MAEVSAASIAGSRRALSRPRLRRLTALSRRSPRPVGCHGFDAQLWASAQGLSSRRMALRMVSSLRMAATRARRAGLPASRRRR